MVTETGSRKSNLESFLNATTPIVPSRFLPKSAGRNFTELWYPWEREAIEFFTLADLWSCYDEWSAYGVGVPITLNNQETVVQYYVPYLSAIQIFTTNPSIANFRDDSVNGDCETRDFSSDTCSDETESEKSWRWEAGSSNDSGVEQERICNQNERLGYLRFEFFEGSNPYGRVPLMDKVNCLAVKSRGLMNLKSIDLSPASWMAVAWYPIYHIPTGKTVKDLAACFLTFHTLSSTFQESEEGRTYAGRMSRKGVSLSPFGLATYKMQMQRSVWVSGDNGREDEERLQSLHSAADSWLKQLGVKHHDFNHFTGIRYG